MFNELLGHNDLMRLYRVGERSIVMLAKTSTCALEGLDGHIVEVEVDISPGLPKFNIVGLPDAAVQESRERVRAAIKNSGAEFPMRRITVSLAPADIRKSGPSYDLPIAIGILVCSGQLPDSLSGSTLLGELSLDGRLRSTHGMLPMISVAKRAGYKTAYVPKVNAPEASLVGGMKVKPTATLAELVGHLRDGMELEDYVGQDVEALAKNAPMVRSHYDLRDVRGQEQAKRAIEIAATGRHNIVMVGPPGSGKTLTARCLPSLMPAMTAEEALEVTTIYSVTGLLPPSTPLIAQRPFRAPHYTISNAGLVGGGAIPRPGEITLSHRGVLFLDELPEFGHSSLETLRQPLEDRSVTISRARTTMTYPADFMLVGAMNPCPCGYYGDKLQSCTCGESGVARYQRRISGPLMDRIDMFVDVPRVEYEKLVTPPSAEGSEQVRERIMSAAAIQASRFEDSQIAANAQMGPLEVWDNCVMSQAAKTLMQSAMHALRMSARSCHKVLKVARTIADLEHADTIENHHLAEAVQYRFKPVV